MQPRLLAGLAVTDLSTPSLVVDDKQMNLNLKEMQDYANGEGIKLRPHSKAHKIPELSLKQIAYGAVGICVQKVSEAQVMVEKGVKNILVSNVVISPEKLELFVELSKKATMSICVDSPEGIESLGRAASGSGIELKCLVEVDCGLHRCGVTPPNARELSLLISKKKNLVFQGIMGYEGHVPNHPTEQWPKLVEQAMAIVSDSKTEITKAGLECKDVVVGGTSTAKISGEYPDVTEITPGEYIFYCKELVDSGVVGLDKCALSVLCTVISRPTEDRAVIDGGLKTFDFDQGVYPCTKDSSFNLEFLYFNEEHAVLKLNDEITKRKLRIGSKLEFIPVHVSTCVNLHDSLYLQDGGKVTEELKVLARGKVW
jgi:D-serine deaminase-like pyridoxal phosphate-dependent protein